MGRILAFSLLAITLLVVASFFIPVGQTSEHTLTVGSSLQVWAHTDNAGYKDYQQGIQSVDPTLENGEPQNVTVWYYIGEIWGDMARIMEDDDGTYKCTLVLSHDGKELSRKDIVHDVNSLQPGQTTVLRLFLDPVAITETGDYTLAVTIYRRTYSGSFSQVATDMQHYLINNNWQISVAG